MGGVTFSYRVEDCFVIIICSLLIWKSKITHYLEVGTCVKEYQVWIFQVCLENSVLLRKNSCDSKFVTESKFLHSESWS